MLFFYCAFVVCSIVAVANQTKSYASLQILDKQPLIQTRKRNHYNVSSYSIQEKWIENLF